MIPVATWPALTRYVDADESAPLSLGFVHDLLNTASLGKPRQPDLLESVEAAQAWLDTSLQTLRAVDDDAPPDGIPLDDKALRKLRDFRDELRTVLSSDSPRSATGLQATAQIALDATGVRIRPRGRGVDQIRSYALIRLAAANEQGTGRRLKICANDRCRGAFYDRSKNCSRVWHDVTTCGNLTNVRAYRARKAGSDA